MWIRSSNPLHHLSTRRTPGFRHGLLALTLLLGLAFSASAGEGPYQGYLEAAYVADAPGAAVIVVRDGEVLFRGARGMASMELGVALEPEHVFRLGSITKQFTAVAVLQLVEQGKIALDDPITRFVPDYPTHGHEITVAQLLTHTSGISNYTNIPGYMGDERIRRDLSTEELVDVFDELEMDFEPGERWSYSNSGYVLLGAIIEEASGMPYSEYVEKHLFEPLGLEDSHYGGPQLVERRVEGYNGAPGQIANAPFLSMTQPHAAGSLLSTVDDLARWNAALFGGEVLSAETLEAMTTKVVLADDTTFDYGYGFQLGDFRGEPIVHHGGGIPGFVTNALWLPESKVYVAVLSNWPEHPVGPTRLARQMAAAAMGKPFPTHVPIEVDAETLQSYVGTYRIDDESTRAVVFEGGKLFTQRSGGPRFEVLAHAEDAFYYPQTFTHLTFERDASGAVTAMHMFHDGGDEAEVASRIADDEAPAVPERETAQVSPEIYDLWAGVYEIRPGFELTIRREEDRLISQATGQPPFELHPASLHRYFVKEFPAELEFEPGDDGRAKSVTLHQGGQEIPATRID